MKNMLEFIGNTVGCIIALPFIGILLSIGLMVFSFVLGMMVWVMDIAFFWL